MYNNTKKEFDIVQEFTHILGLPNKTDGSLFIYKGKEKGDATKPDGYYFYEGITFILDAKSPTSKFTGQLKSYMKLEKNKQYIGFEYNGNIFNCYINGTFEKNETESKDKDYYREKYFPSKQNNEDIVNKSAKRLADFFRNSRINKQTNVPFIGAVMLCIKYNCNIDLTSTDTIILSIKQGINYIIKDDMSLNKRQKREFVLEILGDSSLKDAKNEDLYQIVQEISTIYNFINISADDYKGHDIMNSFLKIFRKWNSADAKEKGEVFTPDHIANIMYYLAHCSKDNTILDPTCGSGTFLTNAMANMFGEIKKDSDFHQTQKKIKENKIIGIESNEFNATLAGINMLLHGDGSSNIFKANCFTKLPELKNLFDRVLMNPPFAQKDCELKFVYETLYRLKDDGYLATILPKPCVKGTQDRDVNYLTKIFEIADLKAVVSLPPDLFYPNAGVNTCIVVLHKTKYPTRETLLINCLNDGFNKINKRQRSDSDNKWNEIKESILKAYLYNEIDEYRAIKKTNLKPCDELLFEAYESHRVVAMSPELYTRYTRELFASKILCGKEIDFSNYTNTKMLENNLLTLKEIEKDCEFTNIPINSLIVKLEKGKEKSISKKIEDKYDPQGIPLIIAKKDNNGVGGMKKNYSISFKDKICIVAGGDGGENLLLRR